MRNYLPLAAIVLVCIIPFSRAIYLDGTHLSTDRPVGSDHWMFPVDTPEIFRDRRSKLRRAHYPPVGEYFLALLYLVLGSFHEVPFQLAFIFPVAAVLGFTACAVLARTVSGLMLAFRPAFCLQPDFDDGHPMLAFLLVGLRCTFDYVQGRRIPSARVSRFVPQ
jgi:hypothetical protein